MVTYAIESKNITKVVYRYYPEDDRESPFGIITIQLKTGDISLDVVAKRDFICRTSADELNEMRDAINQMRRENGEPPLTEEELPIATNGDEWYYYADHAICRIVDDLEKGIILEKGIVMWY